MKYFLLFLSLSLSVFSFSQKKGEFLPCYDPVDKLWESVDGKDGGAPLTGMTQQYFFLTCEGSERSMMAPFKMEEYGFACPTYFTVSLDKEFIYIDINEPCTLDLPEEELFVKVQYKMNSDQTILTLIVDGVNYEYVEWSY